MQYLCLAVGYNVQDFSFELASSYIESKFKSDSNYKVQSSLLLANAYYNLNNIHNVVKPYVGAGVGASKSSLKFSTTIFGFDFTMTQDYKTAFAYQLVAGSKFNIHENVQLFADLRYTTSLKAGMKAVDMEGFNISSFNGKSNISIYSVNIGASYLF